MYDYSNSSRVTKECGLPEVVGYPVIMLNIAGSIFGTFSNILLWLAVLKNKQLQTLSNFFLLNTSSADLIVTAVTQPLFTVYNALRIQGRCLELLMKACSISAYFGCMTSILSITTISIDRLIALKYPLKKRTILTKRRGLGMMLVTWLLAAMYTLLSCVYTNRTWVYITFSYFILSYFVMISAHTHIFIVSHRFAQRRKERARLQNFSLQAYRKDRQAAKTIAIIMTVLTITWLPYGTGLVVYVVTGVRMNARYASVLLTIGFLNSCFNAVLYSWGNKDFKITFHHLLKCQDPNIKRRESASSFYIRKSRLSMLSIALNDSNGQFLGIIKDSSH